MKRSIAVVVRPPGDEGRLEGLRAALLEGHGLARLALVGSGMHKRPGVFAQAFETLRREGVAVHSVSASSTSIILMVSAGDEARAVRLLHDSFGLGAAA